MFPVECARSLWEVLPSVIKEFTDRHKYLNVGIIVNPHSATF